MAGGAHEVLNSCLLTCYMVLSCSVISEMVSKPPPITSAEDNASLYALVALFFDIELELFIFIRILLTIACFEFYACKHSNGIAMNLL